MGLHAPLLQIQICCYKPPYTKPLGETTFCCILLNIHCIKKINFVDHNGIYILYDVQIFCMLKTFWEKCSTLNPTTVGC